MRARVYVCVRARARARVYVSVCVIVLLYQYLFSLTQVWGTVSHRSSLSLTLCITQSSETEAQTERAPGAPLTTKCVPLPSRTQVLTTVHLNWGGGSMS